MTATEPTLIYAHLTPEQALELAREITRTAKAVQKAIAKGQRESYGYVTPSIYAKRNEYKIRLRVGEMAD